VECRVGIRRYWLAHFVTLGVMVVALVGCTSTYYKTMKTFGKEKRDILVSRVKDSKKDQQQAKEQIKTTMESFQELTGFQGGSLEKNYKKLMVSTKRPLIARRSCITGSTPSTRFRTTSSRSGRRRSMGWRTRS
jgi:hypothetical protein